MDCYYVFTPSLTINFDIPELIFRFITRICFFFFATAKNTLKEYKCKEYDILRTR